MAKSQIVIKVIGDVLGFKRALKDAEEATEQSVGGQEKQVGRWRSMWGDAAQHSQKRMAEFSKELKDHGLVGEWAGTKLDGLTAKLGGLPPVALGAAAGIGAAGAAVAALGVAAINEVGDLATATQGLQDVLGGTAEETSTLLVAADQLGVGYDALIDLSKEFSGNMLDNRDVLAEFGVELIHTADGGVDMQATMLAVARRVGEIEDPAQRARLAMAAFGEEGASAIIPLARQMDRLTELQREAEASGMGLSAEDLAAWSGMQRSLKAVNAEMRVVLLQVGQDLLPALAELAGNTAWAARELRELAEDAGVLGSVTSIALAPVRSMNAALGALRGGADETADATARLAQAEAAQAEAQRISTETLDAAKAAQEAAAREVEEAREAYEEYERTIRDVIAAENAKIDAQLEAINVDYAYRGAVDRTQDALDAVKKAQLAVNKAYAESGQDSEQARAAVEALSDAQYAAEGAALAQAAAASRVADANAKAAGASHTAAAAAAIQRDELNRIAAAAGAGGAVDEALRANATRFDAVAVAADGAATSVAAYNAQIWEARTQTGDGGTFRVPSSTGGSSIQVRAAGGPVSAGTPYLVGEEGPELHVPNRSGTIIDAGRTRQLLTARGGAGAAMSGGAGAIINFNGPVYGDERAMAERLRQVWWELERSRF